MKKVTEIFPADDFKNVAKNAAEALECGLVIGYDKDGYLCFYGGGLIDGKRPRVKDWNFMIDVFKSELIAGKYTENE